MSVQTYIENKFIQSSSIILLFHVTEEIPNLLSAFDWINYIDGRPVSTMISEYGVIQSSGNFAENDKRVNE